MSDAVELFTDRAARVRPGFSITADNCGTVTEICRRLDGMPLAIELAAARVRALSLEEILDGLHDRFRLLTGGARTSVRRQQTLYASVDWSHALLTEPERVLFRRLAVFSGGCALDAAEEVGGADGVQRHQVLDQLSLLIDKSLVIAEDHGGRTRYRMLETVRQYALEKLGASGEADAVRLRHRDHYLSLATRLDQPVQHDYDGCLLQAETEIDNLRSAFGWSADVADTEQALTLASALQPLWMSRGRVREGRAWFHAVLGDGRESPPGLTGAVLARSLTDMAALDSLSGAADSLELAQRALESARESDDPALLLRALTNCGYIAGYRAEAAGPYFVEAAALARELGDRWRLGQILAWQANPPVMIGEPKAVRAAAEEGRDLADAIGDRLTSRMCRLCLAWAQLYEGDLPGSAAAFRTVLADSQAAHDRLLESNSLAGLGYALAWQGETDAAGEAADAAIAAATELSEIFTGVGYGSRNTASLAAGHIAAAQQAGEAAHNHLGSMAGTLTGLLPYLAQQELAAGELSAARDQADDAVAIATGWYRSVALTTRARVALAQGDLDNAERDTHDALRSAVDVGAFSGIADTVECLAAVTMQCGDPRVAARLFGAAAHVREQMGAVRFKIWDGDYRQWIATLENSLGSTEFDAAWAEGNSMTMPETIAYAQRGRGKRKRPASGWASLTPTERDVVRLVADGLSNKDIATSLFISPRTVETHLTHVYAKLGINSRVQLARESARHS